MERVTVERPVEEKVQRLTLDFTPEAYSRLEREATRRGKSIPETIIDALAFLEWFENERASGSHILVERNGTAQELLDV